MSTEKRLPNNTAEGQLVIKTEPIDTGYSNADSKDFQHSLEALQQNIKEEPLDTIKIKQEIKVEGIDNQSEDFIVVKKNPINVNTDDVKKEKKKHKHLTDKRQYWPSARRDAVWARGYYNRPRHFFPYINRGNYQRPNSNTIIDLDDLSDDEGNNNFLHIINFPASWNVIQIRSFIENLNGPVYKITMCLNVRSEFTGAVILQFPSSSKCRRAKIILNGKKVEGRRLRVLVADDSDDDSDSGSDLENPAKSRKQRKWRPDRDVWEEDPEGMYGFKLEYLEGLGITPPIGKWLKVSNFKCSRAELRAALEVAGQTMACEVEVLDASKEKCARVCYTHPLEAVQAISMLSGKKLFGEEIKLVMDKPPSIDGPCTLPSGLREVGPGLGRGGKPLRDIIRQFGRYARGRRSEINSTKFKSPHERYVNRANFRPNPPSNPQHMDVDGDNVSPNQAPRPQESHNAANLSPNQSPSPQESHNNGANLSPNPSSTPQESHNAANLSPNQSPRPQESHNNGANLSPNQSSTLQESHNAVNLSPNHSSTPQESHNNEANLSRNLPTRPKESQNNETKGPNRPSTSRSNFVPQPSGPQFRQPNFAFFPRPFGPRSPGPRTKGPFGPQMIHGTIAVELSNLPSDAVFSEIWERMALSGPVVSLEFTAPGFAVVQFPEISHATACYFRNNYTSYKSNIVKARIL